MHRNKLFKYYDKNINRPVIKCELVIGNTPYPQRMLIIDRIDNIKKLLLTFNDGLKLLNGSVYTEVPIKKNQIITYISGKIVPIISDDEGIMKINLPNTTDTRLFLEGYNIEIDRNPDNRGEDRGVGGYIIDVENAKTKSPDVNFEENVEIIFIDTNYNILNSSKKPRYIDSITISDILNNGNNYNEGMRIEDRLIAVRATKDIEPSTELLFETNSEPYWNYLLLEYNKTLENDRIRMEKTIGSSDDDPRTYFEIDRVRLNNVNLKKKIMLLSDLSNINDLFFKIGDELDYKKSSREGQGIFTNVNIHINQVITTYDGKIIPYSELDNYKSGYAAFLIEDIYVILGNYHKNGNILDLKKGLDNIGGGAFINSSNVKNGNNVEFMRLYDDLYNINSVNNAYMNNRFISGILNNDTENVYDIVIIVVAKKNIKEGIELLGNLDLKIKKKKRILIFFISKY